MDSSDKKEILPHTKALLEKSTPEHLKEGFAYIFWAQDVLIRALGLPKDFFDLLEKDDEWSFLIKWHALLESLSNQTLLFHFRDERLEDFLSRIEMSNPKAGKIALLESLEMLSKPEINFIQALSSMRNYAVHDIRNLGFSFKEHFEKHPQGPERFGHACFPYYSHETKKKKVQWPEFLESAREYPQNAVKLSCYVVALKLVIAIQQSQIRHLKVQQAVSLGKAAKATLPQSAPSGEESTPKE